MSDAEFFTNENGETLLDRFKKLIKDTNTFDCLVGYFYASGFSSLSEALESTEKIRVLIGISTDKQTYDLIQYSKASQETTIKCYSDSQIKTAYSQNVQCEMDSSDDSIEVEKGIRRFIEWIRSKKLEIKVYRSNKIHAKVYIMKFHEGDRDTGRVITGSSNFSKSGLEGNLEFNVELKERSTYEFAQKKFDELWEEGVDVSEEYIATIQKKTWLSEDITPYDLYLKFLYEYLKEQINQDKDDREIYLPDGYMELQYQKDAVFDAISKLEQYNGVFISDVVGLGKTYITAMLLKTLNARALIIAPPVLVDRKNPGSWPRVLDDFGVGGCFCESVGKLDSLAKRTDIEKFQYVVIDEAHKFRNENTKMYGTLHNLCKGKRVILVTATPLNNNPKDILSQILLFQPAHASTLPNPATRNLDGYFSKLERRLNGLDRMHDKEKYLMVVRENSERIRQDILQYLMVRRTRSSIMKYYQQDMEKKGIRFPEVADPVSLYYTFTDTVDKIFHSTVARIVKDFTYSRYTPLLYLKKKEIQVETGQKNMRGFMRILLLKRLESSFYAFQMTVSRMIDSYQKTIDLYNQGVVYTGDNSVKNLHKIIEADDFAKIESLIQEGRVQTYSSDAFVDEYIRDLEHDLSVLQSLKDDWATVKSDPKLEKFIRQLRGDQNLKDKKVLIFTESKETADYLKRNLQEVFGDEVLSFDGSSDNSVRQTVIDNFDGKVKIEAQEDKYRILIATEVLSEGVNLHRSNVVINYDIPWNPVRMIQRVGRINRVDTQFKWLYIYNFFPTGPIDENIKLKDLAIAKIEAFIEMLGNDAKLLTDEEVKSHDLFNRLTSRRTITGEDEEEDPELQYLALIRQIRDEEPELFERVKHLPKKARAAKVSDTEGLITFFRRGKLRKIYLSDSSMQTELDFVTAASYLEAEVSEKRMRIPDAIYEHLDRNKKTFADVFRAEEGEVSVKKGIEAKLRSQVSVLSTHQEGFTDDEVKYVFDVLDALDAGDISKKTIKLTYEEMKNSGVHRDGIYRNMYNILRKNITVSMLRRSRDVRPDSNEVTEVILSEYLMRREGV